MKVVRNVDDARPVNIHRGQGKTYSAVRLSWVIERDPIHDGQAKARVPDVPFITHDLDQRLIEAPQEQEPALLLRWFVLEPLGRPELDPEVLLVGPGKRRSDLADGSGHPEAKSLGILSICALNERPVSRVPCGSTEIRIDIGARFILNNS